MKLLFVLFFAAASGAPSQVIYKVRLMGADANRIAQMPAEEYVAAVLAGETGTFQSDEALQAMAVAARTYAARLRGRHAAEGFDFCATTHCQRADPHGITPKLTRAVQATSGELLWFQGEAAFSAYERDCGGEAESVETLWPDLDAPYLRLHPDPYCTRHGTTAWLWTARPEEISGALNRAGLRSPQPLKTIAILHRSESGRARTLRLEGATAIPVSAGSFRLAIGRSLGWNHLLSDFYDITASNGRLIFRGRGSGHGIGLCQRGAEEMGREGLSWRQILAFYFPGTTVSRVGAGLNWTRLGGENVAVLTTHPDQDRSVLALAEDLRASAEAQLHLARATEIRIRVYPDLDTFRNATGEPGWVAARSTSSGIDLQPVATLRSRAALRQTLRHEILHVLIEREAAPGLPVWFREGLVECLENGAPREPATPAPVSDEDFEQRVDRVRAERAYAEARRRVAGLINRYSQAAVLAWVARGLPAEVTNSNKSSAATKSR